MYCPITYLLYFHINHKFPSQQNVINMHCLYVPKLSKIMLDFVANKNKKIIDAKNQMSKSVRLSLTSADSVVSQKNVII